MQRKFSNQLNAMTHARSIVLPLNVWENKCGVDALHVQTATSGNVIHVMLAIICLILIAFLVLQTSAVPEERQTGWFLVVPLVQTTTGTAKLVLLERFLSVNIVVSIVFPVNVVLETVSNPSQNTVYLVPPTRQNVLFVMLDMNWNLEFVKNNRSQR